MATTALAPRLRASSIIRPITSLRLLTRLEVIPLSSPPTRDLKPAPICENALRERTVRPKTSPQTCRISHPGMSFVVTTSIETLLHQPGRRTSPSWPPLGPTTKKGRRLRQQRERRGPEAYPERMKTRQAWAAVGVTLALALSACGSDDSSGNTADDPAADGTATTSATPSPSSDPGVQPADGPVLKAQGFSFHAPQGWAD